MERVVAGGGVTGGGVERIELMAACNASVISCWLNCMNGEMIVWISEISGASGAMVCNECWEICEWCCFVDQLRFHRCCDLSC